MESVNLALSPIHYSKVDQILTDVSPGLGGNHRGSCRLEHGVNRSHYGGLSRSPGRRLVYGRRHNAGDGLGGSLRQGRVDSRAGRRCPWNSGAAILRRSVLGRCVAFRSNSRDNVGRGGEDRQYVESELHLAFRSVSLSSWYEFRE